MRTLAALSFSLFALTSAALAQVQVDTAWVRGTVEGQKATGAFMDLKAERNLKLLSAASPAAKLVEIHAMEMKDGVMKMYAIESLSLPAGKTVRLAPGGFHIMLIDLKQALKNGDSVPITLTLEDEAKKTQTIEVKAEVRGLGMPMQHEKHGKKH
ncbi:MAG: copper chaperone PCu(A)C [Betaproteobacteria bacterium]|nr:copper chaperone PCu(A)C [Betaproteobacteria bacterium]